MPSRLIESLYEFKQITSRDSLVIVFFHCASWSLPSEQIEPIYEQISDLPEYRWLYFCTVNCDHQPDIVSLNGGPYPIPNVPTFIIFRNGRELGRAVGNNKATGIRNFIRNFTPPPHPPPPPQMYHPSGPYYPSN
ncbi:hypothetical protein GALMADRAFT_235061 [Galerina marginata CBS 339.88]|uniref:Thioredoxin domain-containing protein n=1 Tax=Galerina marginata (strain CBS 339.88) TaxID=685588 RepID=A0A067U3B6_GALM3|nr:hypothetical protein GALMADRAFT_235061 [Galerina marginata CBS 339.88]